METIRHKLDLVQGRNRFPVIAPRYFICNGYIHYVHIIDKDCHYVRLYIDLYYENFCRVVASANVLKLHSNAKGLYFNYSYYVDEHKKKTIRVYLCD